MSYTARVTYEILDSKGEVYLRSAKEETIVPLIGADMDLDALSDDAHGIQIAMNTMDLANHVLDRLGDDSRSKIHELAGEMRGNFKRMQDASR